MKKYYMLIWIAIIVELALLLIVGIFFKVDNMTVAKGSRYDFNDGWVLCYENGKEKEISELPYVEPCAANETVIMKNIIPQEYKGMTLTFLSADKELRVRLDGKIIYEFGKHDKRLFGHTPGSVTNFVKIPEHFGRGEIQIEMVSPYNDYATNIRTISVATESTAVLMLLKENLVNFAFTAIIIFSGVVLILLNVIEKFSKQCNSGLGYLGGMCLCGAVYHAIETKALSVFWGNQTIYSYMIFLILMIMPAFMHIYYLVNVKEKYRIRFKILLISCFTNIIVQTVIQCLDILDFMQMSGISHVIVCVSAIVIVVTKIQEVINDYRQKRSIDYYSIIEAFAVFSILSGSIADVIRYYVSPVGDMGKYGRLGMLLYSIVTMAVHIRKIGQSHVEKAEENARLMQEYARVTEEKNRQLQVFNEEAESARQQAIAASNAKSDFLANMSHEIRTPINAVLGMDEMIIRDCEDETICAYATDIQNAGHTLLSLINDILDITKIESGKMEIIEGEYHLSSIINDVYNMLAPRAKEKVLDIKIKVDENIPSVLCGDEVRIREIIVNLLSNAIKYTDKGNVAILANFTKIDINNIKLKIAIADTGKGIKEENQKVLFNSFQRVDVSHNKNIEGTGLGLAITKKLTELMNGTIVVKSRYGVGSTFIVEIPQKVINWSGIGRDFLSYKEKKTTKYSASFTAPTANILVVDDVRMNLTVFASLLKETKVNIDLVSSGEECLNIICGKKYDIIFLDHMMPGLDGVETFEKMKQSEENLNKNVPVIVLTANAIVGARDEYLSMGFTNYLSKPIKSKELEEMICRYLPAEKILK